MHNVTSQHQRLRLAIAPGASSPQLSALLALQRLEEPNVTVALFEPPGDETFEGLCQGRYDVGVSLQRSSNPAVDAQPLWAQNIVAAIPPSFRALDQSELTIADLQNYPVYRWQAEDCCMLDMKLSSVMPVSQEAIQWVTSFEMMALWVAAGYGVGLSTQSRIAHARGWGITMRALADGPYEIVTYLQRLRTQTDSVVERFALRAIQIAETDVM